MKSTLKVKVKNIPVICLRWTNLSHEGYSPFSQTAIARLGETPEMFERQERILNLGSHTRFFTIGLFVSIGQWIISVRTLIGKVPRVGRDGFEKLPLILTPVSAIAIESNFITVQEVRQLLTAVMHIARSHTGVVYLSSLTIYPNMCLHSKCAIN